MHTGYFIDLTLSRYHFDASFLEIHILYELEAMRGFAECLEEYLIILMQNMGVSRSSQHICKFTFCLICLLSKKISPPESLSRLIQLKEIIETKKDYCGAVLDNFLAKWEAWSRAVNAAAIILSIGSMITPAKAGTS